MVITTAINGQSQRAECWIAWTLDPAVVDRALWARADARAVDTRQSEPCGYVHRVLMFEYWGLEFGHGSSAARLIVLSAGEKQFV